MSTLEGEADITSGRFWAKADIVAVALSKVYSPEE